jgi:hypothetical protein
VLLYPGDRTPGIVDAGSPVEWGHDDNTGLSLLLLGLDGAIGSPWPNLTGLSAEATFPSGVAWAETPFGQAGVQFNGTNQYGLLPSIPLGSAGCTLAISFRLTSASTNGTLFKIGSPNGMGFGVGGSTFDSAGNNLIGLREGIAWQTLASSIGTGNFRLLVSSATFTGNWTAYLNGRPVTTANGQNRVNNVLSFGGYATRYWKSGPLTSIWAWGRSRQFTAEEALRDYEWSLDPATDPRLRLYSGSTRFVGAGGGGGGFQSAWARGSNVLIQPLVSA